MKFLKSEGRVIVLVEAEDTSGTPPGVLPHIDLALIPNHHRDHIENSHIWMPLVKALNSKLQNIVYW
jgi:L-ascorbate metabolism protein UlaG (beta-lactamase superfamily)